MKNKEKYDLNKLRISVTHAIVGITDINIYHGTNCVYYKCYSAEKFTLWWITDFMKWLEEYVPNILDDVEKAYLSAVIKPFREKIECIKKINLREEEYLKFCLKGETISFPFFREGTMYKGMKTDKEYTLEELGL